MPDGRFERIEKLRQHYERNWEQTFNKPLISEAERLEIANRLQADLERHAPQLHSYRVLRAEAGNALNFLGVSWTYEDMPTKERVMKAYRFKSMRYHPDVNDSTEANAQMSTLNQARNTVEIVMTRLNIWA